ncbi:MAG TPA: hypothetical protein PKH77_19875 [Anaerolineae bacterium]|nr:hypothetical protein [Anaerolineae bacterium]
MDIETILLIAGGITAVIGCVIFGGQIWAGSEVARNLIVGDDSED